MIRAVMTKDGREGLKLEDLVCAGLSLEFFKSHSDDKKGIRFFSRGEQLERTVKKMQFCIKLHKVCSCEESGTCDLKAFL